MVSAHPFYVARVHFLLAHRFLENAVMATRKSCEETTLTLPFSIYNIISAQRKPRTWRVAFILVLAIFPLLALVKHQSWGSTVISLSGSRISNPSAAAPHTNSVPKTQQYSVKPIAYIFPQYYAFPENDEFWGVNFTEWDNVRRVTHNRMGQETIRPADSIGYYNGLDYYTRLRQGRYLRASGFHGAVYHHYWFAGKPVMDGVIRAMLEDGEPNTPFMLSWANEPWTKRWDGLDSSEILIAQDYGGLEAWRAHFDCLLTFFRHPQYIRSEGKIQFLVYNPGHMGDVGPHMFAAWKQWAVEEGLGGLDVIETKWQRDKWNQGIPDAINEFAPHSAGADPFSHPFTNRISRVYHRGTIVCWDTSPRHAKDGQASINSVFCHPKSWESHVVEQLQRIKEDPNPIGAENFLFVNALNEWGEGNALEPSVQFGDRYGKAMKKALQRSEELHSWPDEMLHRARKLEKETNRLDVCVLVNTNGAHAVGTKFDLPATMRSLQGQENSNWQAIVFETTTALPGIKELVYRMIDPRITLVSVPETYIDEDSRINWIISGMNQSDPRCCARAKYLLVTTGDTYYAPKAFNTVLTGDGSLLGLKAESRSTIWNYENQTNIAWENRCNRLEVSLARVSERRMQAK